MTYQIGQQVALDYTRTIMGKGFDRPKWFAMTVPPQKERAAREYLKARGVHACYPEREKSYLIRGKRQKRHFPIITQIVYAKFHRQPNWDVLKARRIITGVFSYGVTPIVIPGDVIAGVMGLPTEAERLEEARREMMRVREGDRAIIAEGPLQGVTVDVRTVSEGRVWFETLTGIKGEASERGLERVLPLE